MVDMNKLTILIGNELKDIPPIISSAYICHLRDDIVKVIIKNYVLKEK